MVKRFDLQREMRLEREREREREKGSLYTLLIRKENRVYTTARGRQKERLSQPEEERERKIYCVREKEKDRAWNKRKENSVLTKKRKCSKKELEKTETIAYKQILDDRINKKFSQQNRSSLYCQYITSLF